MSKRIIQDVIIKKRQIIIERKIEKDESPKIDIKKKRNLKKWIIVIIIFILVSFAIFKVLDNFSYAKVIIKSIEKIEDVNYKLKAINNNQKNDLYFEVMTMEYSLQKILPSTSTQYVERKASGTIVIFNKYDSKPLSLKEETRFEASNGKIYKTKDRVVVPGNPGSIEVIVYADQPGEEYNIGLSDFTLPGLKGTARYEKVFARSKTKIEGGYKEQINFASKEDIESARNNLRQSIEKYLRDSISKQKPKDFLMYDGAGKIDFSTMNHPNENEVEEKGIITAYLFNQSNLSDYLVNKKISDKGSMGIDLINIDKLDFELISSNDAGTEIYFNIKGKGHFVWRVDKDSIINDLMNSKDKNIESVFKRYLHIEYAEVNFIPSWWHHIPKDASRIKFEHSISN
mgnify:FL=1